MSQLTYQEFEQMRLDVPTDELIQKASDALSELCKTGAESFIMTIPPRLSDTDIVFADLINRFKVERTKLKELVAGASYQSSRMVSLESELRELLEKWALENTIKKRFESNAVDRNNDRAAQMWRHKREGVERCVNDVKKVLEKYSIDIKKDYQND